MLVAVMAEKYRSLPCEEEHGCFLRDIVELLLKEAVFGGTRRDEPVVRWRDPEHLKEILDLSLPELPVEHKELLRAVHNTVMFSVKTGHPYFFNQLYSSLDPYGLAGQWVTDALNPSVYTYEVAPVFTLMEVAVLEEMRILVGFPEGEGMFCPGGSLANGYAINLARFHFNPDVKKEGIHPLPRLVLFASEDAHYSVHKMAALLGLGENNVYCVRTDIRGQMDVHHLEESVDKALEEGAAPFMVVATAGTTVLGAFDPLPALADICARYKLWLHVDAAWGGGLLFSRTYRHKLVGLDRADSVAWNPHKLLAAPQQCSVLLVRHSDLLESCHSRRASYLFQKDKFYDTSYDMGDKYLQCGRRADVFKFWLMWKAKGTLGLEKHVDTVMECAEYFRVQVSTRPRFKLVIEPDFVNVCFWFIPERLREGQEEASYTRALHEVAPRMKEQMMRKGSLMIGYQPLRNWPNFFRFVVQNSGVTRQDIDYVLDELERLGTNL
uniref:Cysteine sulfinic acid decarboxylase n=1 Tax=Timema tahoe TaxID=61484 RepID=A0A7R9FJI0_9NEOP|nr:unnamed protein product [Timema tahoe]